MHRFSVLDAPAGWSVVRWLNALAFLLLVLFACSTPLRAQTVEAWQRAAIQRHPELGQAGSPLNQKFIAIVTEKRKSDPSFFTRTDWPVRAADLAVAAVQADAAAEAEKAKAAADKSKAADEARLAKMTPDEQEWDKQKSKWFFEKLVFGDKEDDVAKKLYTSKLITARTSPSLRVQIGERFRWVLGDAKYNADFEMKDGGLAAIVFNSQPEDTGKANGFLHDDWEKLRAAAIEQFGPPAQTFPFPDAKKLRGPGWKVTDTWVQKGAHIKLGVSADGDQSSASLRLSDPARVAD